MSAKPIIAIACNLAHIKEKDHIAVLSSYTEPILKAGGAPVIIPLTEDEEVLESCLDAAGGLLIPGGIDVYPLLYHDMPNPQLGHVEPALDMFQIKLFHLAHRRKMPILGICRGAQVINVAMGGTLIQHIPTLKTQIGHVQDMNGCWPCHSVCAESGSIVAEVYGDTFEVNSFHHQSVKTPGEGLKITAAAPDGIVEAVESKDDAFLVGLQWHPERMTAGGSASQSLFQRFVAEAAKYRA